MIKSTDVNGTASVTFTIGPEVGGHQAAVCGDWNDWHAKRDLMEPAAGGGFTLTLALPRGQTYRFRYLLDGERWENDWAADAYVPNGFGGDDGVVDLTAPASTSAGAKKATSTKKTTATKKATPAKKAPPAKKTG
jgi:1,4-alpha-glucan branching enzyme